jgi:hypothetical protein
VEGPVDGEGLFELCLRACALFGSKGPRTLLVDVRRVEWRAATTDTHYFASTMERPQGIRISLLCRDEDADAYVLETVAANHEVSLRRFHDEAQALGAVEVQALAS